MATVPRRERYNSRAVPSRFDAAWLKAEFQAVQRAIPYSIVADARDYQIGSGGDDAVRFRNFVNQVSDSTTLYIPSGTLITMATTLIADSRENIAIVGAIGLDPRQARYPVTDGQIGLKWTGAAGGMFFDFENCSYCRISGFNVDMGVADTFVRWDHTHSAHLSSKNAVSYCAVNARTPRATQKIIQRDVNNVGPTGENGDYILTEHCVFISWGGPTRTTATIAALTLGTVACQAITPSTPIGTRIRVDRAGPGGGILDTTLDAVGSGTGTLHVAATGAVTGAYTYLGESLGTAMFGGSNSNAHKNEYVDLNFSGWAIGIDFKNGSFNGAGIQGTNNEIDIQVGALAHGSKLSDYRSEFSRQNIVQTVGKKLEVDGCSSLDISDALMSSASIDNQGPGSIKLNCLFLENSLPTTTARFFNSAQGRKQILEECEFSPSDTLAHLFGVFGAAATAKSPLWLEDCDGISDVPTGTLLGFATFGNRPLNSGDMGADQCQISYDESKNMGYMLAVHADGTTTRMPGFVPILEGSIAFGGTVVASPGQVQIAMTVTGAVLGNLAIASYDKDIQNLDICAEVRGSGANNVWIIMENNTGAAVTLAAGTARVLIFQTP